ncbi:hypothetical protein GCM10022225_80270 [Plantactinospora mayteni]|uniref:Uncharacterized protein n=1 Tax=Plantactinospora mayteni TaxID=566021 RepID=A0ABQ4F383_9ACTN|nr:DUF6069 family protein [Plantactinospora mayteni]GIH01376.1 hypothetical protein Pma05_79480 [Plantactinospora mayteni]
MPERSRTAVVALSGATAVAVNLVIYGIGRAAGGSFRFTSATGPAEVYAITVAGFSLIPLLVGLTAVALLAPFAAWVVRAAFIIGPTLALGTILVMTAPANLDTTSKVALALCHLTLVPISIVAVRAIARRAQTIRTTRATTP